MSLHIDDEEFEGGVFSAEVPEGRARAVLRAGPEGLMAKTQDGQLLRLAWRNLSIERGGASGRVIRCSGPGRRPTTFWSESDGFLRALESWGGNEVADALARLEGARVSSRRRHLLLWALVLLVVVAAVRAVPILFRSSIRAAVHGIPTSVDRRIGELAFEAMDAGGPLVEDELVDEALSTILERLLPSGELFDEPVEVRVVREDSVNAFALPGGFLTVHSGLIVEAEGPAEVAGVLAHELAHAELRHGLSRIAHSLGTVAAVRLFLGDAEGLLGLATEVFTTSTVNDYSREQEAAADQSAVLRLLEARIDPEALAGFFDRLQAEGGELPTGLGWMASHPRSAERAAEVRRLARAGDSVSFEPFELDWEEVRAKLGP